MIEVLPLSSWSPGPRQQVLPHRPCSYALMRQSSTLLSPLVYPLALGLGRLRSAPAGRRTFPTLSLRILPCVLGPLPRRLLRCMYPFLPPRHRPSPRSDRVGAPQCPCSGFSTAPFSRLQSFPHVQAHRFAHHPGRSYRCGEVPQGSRGFYVRASRGSLPPHAPDMLAVRIGQLTAEDFHLLRCAALSAAPRTPGVRRAWKREHSGRCKASAPCLC
jgi:hypothetical protein